MNSNLNESIEVARNHNYLNQMKVGASEHPLKYMCSSIISQPHQASSIGKSTRNIRKAILSKLKQFRKRITMTETTSIKSTDTPALQKFSYLTEISSIPTVTLNSSYVNDFTKSETSVIIHNEEPSATTNLLNSDIFLFNNSDEISHLFELKEQSSDETNILMEGPNFCRISDNIMSCDNPESASTPIITRRCFTSQESIAYDMTIDESTQVIEAPILIESTFDTSSCSNLSSDLIILQTEYLKTSNSVQKEYQNSDNFCQFVPEWATGFQLNLAVVNQVYFEQNGTKLFR